VTSPEEDDRRPPQRILLAAGIVALLVAIAALGYALAPSTKGNKPATAVQPISSPTPAPTSTYEVLAVGQNLDWEADKAEAETIRQAGPYVLTIAKKMDSDDSSMVAPVVTLRRGADSIVMEGESVSDGYEHHIALVQLERGAPPVVMLQSFSGGAHCCTTIQLAGDFGGMLRKVDLGGWDGDGNGLPKDVSGDGVADFVMVDNSFLYAFAPYAMSYAPPQILDVVGGKVVDVSEKRAFRSQYLATLKDAGNDCRTSDDDLTRNGACAAYVAAAARLGKLDEAWPVMLEHYSAQVDWSNPMGCAVVTKGECPKGDEITYQSYPEALLAFLKSQGYVRRGWLPPETYSPNAVGQDDPYGA